MGSYSFPFVCNVCLYWCLLVTRRVNTASTCFALAPLGPLAANTARKLDVLRHDGHALGVDRAEVGVLEQPDQVRLACLLEGEHGERLEPEVCATKCRPLMPSVKWAAAALGCSSAG